MGDDSQELPFQREGWQVRDQSVTIFSTICSSIHTAMILLLGFCSLVADIMQATWSTQGLESFVIRPNTFVENVIFSFSLLYYSLDIVLLLVIIWRYRRAAKSSGKPFCLLARTSWAVQRDLGFLLHHLACLWGLIGSLSTGHDATLILIGFTVGEVSNPPRILTTLSSLFPARLKKIRRLRQYLESWHLLLFMTTRVLLAKYVASVVSSYASQTSTIGSASAILLLSFIALAITFKGQASTNAFII
ncbi:hypothetical protein AAMO2058_000774000 [Amorphochlora amoebiformis]